MLTYLLNLHKNSLTLSH